MKKKILFILFTFILLNAEAQTLNPSVLGTAGGYGSAGNAQLSWTVGEPFNTTFINNFALTQGFQQPELQVWTGDVNMPSWGLCSSIQVPYTASGIISPQNVFTAELSDADGNFASPTVIGTATGNTNGTINAVIPQTVPAGTGYRIRVRSSIPQFTGLDNGSDLVIRKASIPDAYAFGAGAAPNTIYQGWDAAEDITLVANPNGAVNPKYEWRGTKNNKVLSTNQSFTVSGPDTYTVTVTDTYGCSTTASVTITQVNIGCGSKKFPGITICYNNNVYCMDPDLAFFYLVFGGANLGPCNNNRSITKTLKTAPEPQKGIFAVNAYPNPTTTEFTLQLRSDNARDNITVRVIDVRGVAIQEIPGLRAQQVIRVGSTYRPGVYFIEMIQGSSRITQKVIKIPN